MNKYNTRTKILGATTMMILAVSVLSFTTIFNPKIANAAFCIDTWGQNCYGISIHTLSSNQEGASVQLKYNQPTSIVSSRWVANPFWVKLANGNFVETGWLDTAPAGNAVCYWTSNIFGGQEWGTPSTTLATYFLQDTNNDSKWEVTACGSTKVTGDLGSSQIVNIQSGYESSDDANNVNTGETKSARYQNSSFAWVYVDHPDNGNSSKFLNPGAGYLWVHYCDTTSDRTRSHYMYGDGTEGNPC